MPAFLGCREGIGDGDSRDTPRTCPCGLYQLLQFLEPAQLFLLGIEIHQLLWRGQRMSKAVLAHSERRPSLGRGG